MIMNPMTRKMFKSRDARTKLRGMGGILASSPELAQTVQQFQDGGDVSYRLPDDLSKSVGSALSYNISNQGRGVNTPNANVIDAYLRGELDPSSKAYRDMVTFEQLNGRDKLREISSQIVNPFGQSPSYSSRDEITPRMSQEDAIAARRRLAGGAGVSTMPDTGGAGVSAMPDTGGGFGSNVEYTYSTFLAENNLNDTPQAREMFAKYKVYMDTRDPLTDPQLFSSVGFDRAPSALGDAPMTSAVEFDLNRQFSQPAMPSAPAGLAALSVEPDAAFTRQTSPAAPAAPPPSILPELTSEELAMQAYAESLAQQYAPIGEDLQSMDDTLARAGEAASELGRRFVAPKVGPEAVTFPGAEGRAIIRGDLTAADMMPPPPITPDLPAEERRMDYVPESETPVVEAPAPAADADAETPAPDGDAGTGTGTLNVDPEKLAPLMPQPGDTDADVRAKYKDRLKLFQEILGEDEAGARNKGMDLAMIGLAIMSGQSPNFLTNIAQGGVAGLQAMSARDEAARERQRLLRTTALESVLDEEAAAKSAAATAAEKALDRQTRIDVANIGADGGTDYTPAELVTYRTAYNAAFKAATERGAKPQAVKDGMSPEDYATQMANSAVTSSRTFFSGEAQPSVQPPPSAVSSPQELEAAAKAAGRPTFVYNGMEYPVR
jgi:hypothetical protein